MALNALPTSFSEISRRARKTTEPAARTRRSASAGRAMCYRPDTSRHGRVSSCTPPAKPQRPGGGQHRAFSVNLP